MPKTAAKPDRLKQAHDKLTAAVEAIVSGDDWKRMLKVVSKFHRYSFNNHLMEPPSNGPRCRSACVLGRRVGLRPKEQRATTRSVDPYFAR